MGQQKESGVTEVKTKLVVVGDCGCGKSKLVNRYLTNTFTEGYTSTGIESYSTLYSVSATYKINLAIWDTSGDSGYDRVRPVSYTDADLILICFSIGNPDSLSNIASKWVPEVREHCPNQPIIVVGCGTDMRTDETVLAKLARKDQTPVTYEQGLKAAKDIEALVYSEASSKTSLDSVKDVIEIAALSSVGTKSNQNDLKRQKSFMKKKTPGMKDVKSSIRKEATKSCAIM